jgi:hypothetical protein
MLGSFCSSFVDKEWLYYCLKLNLFASLLVTHAFNINWLPSVTVLGHCSDVSSLSRPYSGVSYHCILAGCEFCFMWCRVWNLGCSSRCWQMKRSWCWEQEGYRIDAGSKKKLNLNPRTNHSPLSLITFGYDTSLYNSISPFISACMSVNFLPLLLFAYYTTFNYLIYDLLLHVTVSYIHANVD